MLMVNMSKDFREYSPKVIFSLTRRQALCLVPAALIYSRTPLLTRAGVPMEYAVLLLTIPVLPILACGWISIFGMPLEKFLYLVIKNYLLVPRTRYYSTERVFGYLDEDKEPKDGKTKKQDADSMTRKQKKKYKADLRRYGAVR